LRETTMLRILSACVLLGMIGSAAIQGDTDADENITSLLKELKSKNATVRTTAAKEIGRLGAIRASDVKEAVPVLLNMVKKDLDAAPRKAAIEALGRIDPDAKETVPVLLGALKDKSPTVREAAAAALGQFPSESEEIIPVLKESEKDKNKMVERAAKMAIRNLREQKKEE
jgi:HEAT repeat protein